jgi:hypothetical protein
MVAAVLLALATSIDIICRQNLEVWKPGNVVEAA